MSRPRIAVIGAGTWGRNHIRTLSTMPEAELAVVCDRDPKRLAAAEGLAPAARRTGDVADALRDVDGVVIATQANAHRVVAQEAIDRRIPVLIEKPLTLNTNDAEAVVRQAQGADTPVLVGHLLLFHPVVERLREMMGEGALGSVYYMYSQRVNLGQVRPDENALWSFGPHDVSVAMHLLGDAPIAVAAQGKSYLQPGVEDVVFLTMEFGSGVMAHVQMSWLDPHKERRLTIVGSQRMVVFDDMQPREKLRVYDKGVDRPPAYGSYGESLAVREGDVWIPRVATGEPLRAELGHFLEVVGGKASPRVSVQDGAAVVRVLAAASKSLEQGGERVDMSAGAGFG